MLLLQLLEEIEKEGAGALKELIKKDPTMVFKILSNETEKLSIAFGSLLAPVILDATRVLTSLTTAVTAFVQSPLGKTITLFTGIAIAVKAATAASGFIIRSKDYSYCKICSNIYRSNST